MAETNTETAKTETKLTTEQKNNRLARRHELYVRVVGSGKVEPDDAPQLASEIEDYEWAAGDAAESQRRHTIVMSLLATGNVDMPDIVKRAKALIATLAKFE